MVDKVLRLQSSDISLIGKLHRHQQYYFRMTTHFLDSSEQLWLLFFVVGTKCWYCGNPVCMKENARLLGNEFY